MREEFKNIFINGLSEESIVIFSTTDPREAMELNGEVIVLDEGRVLQVGAAKEIFENPKNLKVAAISNDPPMNILKADIDSNKIRFEDIEIDAPDEVQAEEDAITAAGLMDKKTWLEHPESLYSEEYDFEFVYL